MTYEGGSCLLSQFAEGLCQAAWGGVPKRSHACYLSVPVYTMPNSAQLCEDQSCQQREIPS